LLLADDETRLGPPEELVSTERDHVGAHRHPFGDQGFPWQAESAEVDEGPAAQILHDRDAVLTANADQFRQTHFQGKPNDAVVARMNFEQQAGLVIDASLVVPGVRSVGRAYFSEDGSAFGHDFGDPKRPADLDQFAA
jgi:hypothetical protein